MYSSPPGNYSTPPIDALERVYYLHRGLQAIRQIGRLIQAEAEPDNLLQQTAYVLEATGAYFDIWIIAEGRGFDAIAASETVDRALLGADRHGITGCRCVASMIKEEETSAFVCSGSCGLCPDASLEVSVQFVSSLRYGERHYGYMKASSPTQYAVEEKEWAILENVAQDLALALFKFEQGQDKYAAELALAESERRYKTIFDGSIEGIVIAERSSLKVRYANPAYCAMFGYSPEQLLGMELGKLHDLDAGEEREIEHETVGSEERKRSLGVDGKRSDGSLINLSINSQVMDIDEEPCIVAFCTDTTESMEQLRKLRRYSASIHATIEGVLIADARGEIVDGNSAAVEQLGRETLSELLGESLFFFGATDERPGELWERLTENGHIELQGRKLGGRRIDVTAALIWNDIEEIEGAVCTLRDVTEREQREQETREKNRLLAAVNRLFHEALEMETFDDVIAHSLDVVLDLMDAELGFVIETESDEKPRKLTVRAADADGVQVTRVDGTEALLPSEWNEVLAANNSYGTSENEHLLPNITNGSETLYRSVMLATLEPLSGRNAVLGILSQEPTFDEANIMALYVLADSVVHVLRRLQAEEQLNVAQDELRKSHESFVNIVERSRDGVIVVGKDEIVRFANPSAASGFETSVDNLVGEWFNATSPDGLSREVGILKEDGYPGTAEMAVQDTVWEDEEATLVLLRDVTARKNAEMAQLELSRQMSRVIKKLQDLDRTKNEFIANTSHELKTPLNAIMGYLSLMTDGLGGELSVTQSKWIDSMARQSRTLLGLINQILDFSRMEAGKLQVEPRLVPLESFIVELHSVAEALVKEKPIEIKVHLDSDLRQFVTDPDRLQQILVNLISNAAKFTAEGEIEISMHARGDDAVSISVRDTGIGIAEADHLRIFNPFEQVDGTSTRKYGGTGLGLPIVKRLVELLGGSVAMESQLGKGATFTLELPRDLQAVDENAHSKEHTQ